MISYYPVDSSAELWAKKWELGKKQTKTNNLIA